jgi:hypothetical protein
VQGLGAEAGRKVTLSNPFLRNRREVRAGSMRRASTAKPCGSDPRIAEAWACGRSFSLPMRDDPSQLAAGTRE